MLHILYGNTAKTGIIRSYLWKTEERVIAERLENLSDYTGNKALEKTAVGHYELPITRSI